MKIIKVKEDYIKFSNGKEITYEHNQDCCEFNYADFDQLEDDALNYEFSEELSFEFVQETGFRFGDSGRMFFVPCYSEQNGYYSNDISILYDNEVVISGYCKEILK